VSAALITWGRFFDPAGNKVTVPAPSTNPGAPWLWDFLTSQASDLRQWFNAWQLPPVSKAQGGAGAGCDGYEVYDLRDIGSKNQQGSIPSRYGSRESLLRAIATAHANGIEVQLDISMHQIGGDSNGFLQYFGSDGKTKNGRGAITPGELRGNTSWNPATKAFNDPIPPFSREDAVPVPFYDYPFGRERVFQNCQPPRKSINDCVDFGSWLLRSTGARGPHRFDDVKGTWAPFVAEWMNSGEMARQQFYSEFYASAADAAAWANNYPMSGRSGLEDFDAHYAIQDACNNGNAWALNRGGGFSWLPDLFWPFVETPDTDTSRSPGDQTPGQQVVLNKLLGYLYLLTIPCRCALVYAKDYFGSNVWPGAYGLKKSLDPMLWSARRMAFGEMTTQFCDSKAIVLQRNGQGGVIGNSPGMLSCLNFDTWNRRKLTVPTCFWPGTQLHDFLGHHEDIVVSSNQTATFTIPSDAYNAGQSSMCFSWAGIEGSVYELVSRPTTQVFEGAADLDIGPAPPGVYMPVGRISCAAGTNLKLSVALPAGAEEASIWVTDPAGGTLVSEPATSLSLKIRTSGWYSLSISAVGAVAVPFALTATYTAPR